MYITWERRGSKANEKKRVGGGYLCTWFGEEQKPKGGGPGGGGAERLVKGDGEKVLPSIRIARATINRWKLGERCEHGMLSKGLPLLEPDAFLLWGGR